MVAAAVTDGFRLGRIIDQTFRILGRNVLLFVLLALVGELPKLALSLFLLHVPGSSTFLSIHGTPAWLVNELQSLGIGAFGSTISYLVAAALAQGTLADLNGRTVSLGACLTAALREPLSLAAIGVVSYIVVSLGTLLLIIPGMIIAMAWAVVVPVKVVERTPIKNTFLRSAELTRDYRGQIFGLYLVLLAAIAPLSLAALRVSGFGFLQARLARSSATYLIAYSSVELISWLLVGVGTAVVYYQLRSIKEGIGPEQQAKVFD